MIDRIRAFSRELQERFAERSVPTEHGVARLADSMRDVYDANFLSVDGPVASADVLAAESNGPLADRYHRRVIVEGGGAGLAERFAELQFTLSTHLVLAHQREPDRLVDTSAVREVSLADLLPARTRTILAEPWGDAEIAVQLNHAKRRIEEAVPTRFFAAFVDDVPAGYCEVRTCDGVAQIEDVEVLEEFRGRGLGRTIVQHALFEARRSADIVFLEALADDWPRELYAKLGFVHVGHRDLYTRLPHALTRLRVRTPRLELRLATIAELQRLYEVAEAGIHDPEDMPFEFAWTDTLERDTFVAFHEDALRAWSTDDWQLNLVAFLDGAPIGSQGIGAKRFGRDRTVSTGSWLGRAWQGHGLGTEMRAAVLSFAFEGLGAKLARSGAIDGNGPSLGVSRKLGYAEVGSHTVRPRGAPLEHTDLELQRDAFSSPAPVETSGLPRLLQLFGAAG